MSNYPNTTLTNAGQDLLAESIAESKALIFTKVELGDGTLAAGQSISMLTALISSKMNVPLSSGSADDGQAKIRFIVGNSGLEEGFFAREVGIFAKAGEDGVETLYAYTNGGNYVDFIPDQTRPIDEQIMDVYIVTGNAAEVRIQVDSAAYLTVEDLAEHEENYEAHKIVYGAFLRQKSTEYAVKDVTFLPALGAKLYLECTVGGTTSDSKLTIASPASGNTVIDGTVTWKIRKISSLDELPVASSSTLGGVKIGSNISVSNGTISLSKSNVTSALGYTPPSSNGGIVAQSLRTNGYVKFNNGFILQWGCLSSVPQNQQWQSVTFPISFTSAAYTVLATLGRSAGASGTIAALVNSSAITKTGCQIMGDFDTNAATGNIYWIALGS